MYTEYYLMQLLLLDTMITFNSNWNTQGYLLTTGNLSSCQRLVACFQNNIIMPTKLRFQNFALHWKSPSLVPFANFLFSDFVPPTVSLSASQGLLLLITTTAFAIHYLHFFLFLVFLFFLLAPLNVCLTLITVISLHTWASKLCILK